MVIKKFQTGGAAPVAPAAVPALEQGGDPLVQLAEMAMAALESQDANLAFQVCEGFVMLLQESMGAGVQPVGGDPAAAGAPVFRKGGKICRRIKK